MVDRRGNPFPGWIALLVIVCGLQFARAEQQPHSHSAINERMQQFVDDGQASGIVTLVADRNRVLHLGAVGLADIENSVPMSTDSLFAVASMTKPIVAAAVMKLVDQHDLSLDDPVSIYIPAFANVRLKSGEPAKKVMTIRHLLTHTSGLSGDQQNEGSLAETAEALAKRPLEFEPGTSWQYSPSLNVAGRIVEVVSENSLDAFLENEIFQPLEMGDTSFLPRPDLMPRVAKLYQPNADSKKLESTTHWIHRISEDRPTNPSGGLFSTAEDMAHFHQMILGRGQWNGQRVLTDTSVAEMCKLQTADLTTGFTPGNGWGLGFCVILKPQGVTEMLSAGSLGHGGALGTQGWIDPEKELIFIVMMQRMGFGNSDASEIRSEFQRLAIDAFHK